MIMCIVCNRIKMIENDENRYFVRETDTGYIVFGDNQHFLGYVQFLCKIHSEGISELDDELYSKYLLELKKIQKCVKEAFKADFIDIELLGNGSSCHPVWNIYPRRKGDLEGYGIGGNGPVWYLPIDKMYGNDTIPSEDQLNEMIYLLNNELDKVF